MVLKHNLDPWVGILVCLQSGESISKCCTIAYLTVLLFEELKTELIKDIKWDKTSSTKIRGEQN